MRQFSMVQDWGYDYIYLRHETAITRVNLKNHTYRDVTHLPMEEFDSGSSEAESFESSSKKDKTNLCLCDASRTSKQTDGCAWCRDVMDEAYIPMPFPKDLMKPVFPKDLMEPVEWIHCLATLDASTLCPRTKFCDEEGYDIVPIRMIRVIPNEQDERPQDNVANPRKGGVPSSAGNKNILPPWDPSWRASLTSSSHTRGLPKDAPRSLSTRKVAQASATPKNLTPVNRLCAGCDVDHLIKNCPHYQANQQDHGYKFLTHLK